MINKQKKEKKIDYKFKGKGSYGCVVTPALPCKGDKSTKETQQSKQYKQYKQSKQSQDEDLPGVSKLFFKKKNAKREFEIRDLLIKIDPEQQYVIMPSRICSTDISVLSEDVFSKCDFDDVSTNSTFLTTRTANNNNNDTNKGGTVSDEGYNAMHDAPSLKKKQIVYDDGGSSLKKVFQNHTWIMFEDLLPHLTNVFEGLIHLQKHHIVHMDMKPGNLVFNQDEKTRKIRIIDFGLVEYIPRLREIALNPDKRTGSSFWRRAMHYKYPYYPIDFLILVILFNKKVNVKKRFEMLRQALELKTKLSREPFSLNQTKTALSEDYYRYFVPLATQSDKMLKQFVKELPEKIDIFGLGVGLFEIYALAQKLARFKDAVWCEENVVPLLKKLTHPILTERLNPTNALKEWQTLVRKLKKRKKEEYK